MTNLMCAAIFAVYFIGALATFGPVTVHFERCAATKVERDNAAGPGIFLAMFWPLYWPGVLSYEAAGGSYECGR